MHRIESECPEDRYIPRCRLPQSVFKRESLAINQWVCITTSDKVIYSRAWPSNKNTLEDIVQANETIARTHSTQYEMETCKKLASGYCDVRPLKQKFSNAAQITLSSDSYDEKTRKSLNIALGQLNGMVLCKGCRVELNLGWKTVCATVSEITPDRNCIVTQNTVVSLADGVIIPKLNFAIAPPNIPGMRVQLAGLEEAFDSLVEIVGLPIIYHKLVSAINIKCPKSILLYGPPVYLIG